MNLRIFIKIYFYIFCCLLPLNALGTTLKIYNGQGSMSGEVTSTSVILQSRLTQRPFLVDGDLPGVKGVGRFEVSMDRDFQSIERKTKWISASIANDYIIKTKIFGLMPGTKYFYRLRYGSNKKDTILGQWCVFQTLPGSKKSALISFVVVTGMNYAFFHEGAPRFDRPKYEGSDKNLGYPALGTILKMKPDFFVGTGDNVYYDHPASTRARTQSELRKKWHEQFVQSRFIELFRWIPTYWEKDDHDYRFNDADSIDPVRGHHVTKEDLENPRLAHQPSDELGRLTFLEQLPIVDPLKKNPKTYRSHRVSKELQIWLMEGRDHRSRNEMIDGPEKSIWGQEQKAWLKQTLLASDASFKILILPTPMVGPDGVKKKDNHVNTEGFRYEADQFFGWLKDNGFLDKQLYLVSGDRHWQYHAIHPSGFEEFSCGAICDANAFKAIKPGDSNSTDPKGEVKHKYTQHGQSGGFLRISVYPPKDLRPAEIKFAFYDEQGVVLYQVSKIAGNFF